MSLKNFTIVLLFFLVQGLTYSQENNSTLDNNSLLDAANKHDLSLVNPLKILGEGQDILSKLATSLQNTEAQLQKPSPQENTEPVTQKNIQEKIKNLTELEKFLQEKHGLYEDAISQLKKYEAQLEENKERANIVVNLLQEFVQLLKEIELRITTKSLNPQSFPPSLKDKKAQDFQIQKEQIEKSVALWGVQQQKIPARRKVLEENAAKEQQKQQQIHQQIVLLEKQSVVYQKKMQIQKELQEKKPDTLLALLSSIGPDVVKKADDFDKKLTVFDEAKSQLKTLQTDTPPDYSQIKTVSKIPSTIEAEKNWKSNNIVLDYKKNSLKRLQESITLMTKLIKEAQDLNEQYTQFYDTILQLDTIIEILTPLQPEKLSALPIDQYKVIIEKHHNKRQNFFYYDNPISAWQQQIKIAQQQIDDLSSTIEETKQQVEKLQKVYEEEKKWEKWVVDVDKLDENQLNEKLTSYLKTAQEKYKKIQEFQQMVSTLRVLHKNQQQTVHKIQSPTVVYSQQALQDLYTQAQRCIEQIATEKQYKISLRLDRNISNADLKKYLQKLTQIARGFPNNMPEGEIEQLEQQLDFFSNVLTVAKEKQIAQQKLQQILNDISQQKQLQLAQMKERMLELRKAYGAATEFQIRLGKKEITSIPEEVKNVPGKGELVAIDTEIQKVQQKISAVKKSMEEQNKNASEISQYVKHIETRISIILEKLKYLQKRRKMQEDFAAKELTNTQQQQQQQAIYETKLTYSIWWVNLLSFFSSKEAEQQENLLNSYFADLVTLRRKIENLEKRALLNQSLIKAADEEQQTLQSYTLHSPQQQLDMHLAEIEARLKPSSLQKDILDSFFPDNSENITLPNSLSNEKRQEYIPTAADEVFRSWVTLLTFQAQQNAVEYDTSKLGIATEVAKYKEDIGRIESKKRQIKPDINKLTGHSLASLHSLDPIEKPQNKDQENRYLQGEIHYTQQLQANALLRSAFISICNLIFIPILALLLIRVLNRVGEKIIHRVTASSYSNQKVREQRAQTLLGILKTTWTALIFIIAGIYMLEQFRIDITPIIASAGVLGLALAFGAQTLVRDYISGFFILLENQYATGDMVEIDGITGCIIKITLRLTILRAFDGTIHFFPNGTVQHISNKSKNSRAVINIGVAYSTPVDKVLEILHQVAVDMRQDPQVGPKVLEEYEIQGLDNFGDSAITYRMWLKTTPGDQWAVKRAAQRRIKIYFDKHNIEIPFPQRVLYTPKELSTEEQQQHFSEVEETYHDAKTKLTPVQQVQKEQKALIEEKKNAPVSAEELQNDSDVQQDDDVDDSMTEPQVKVKKKRRKKKKKK
ncbi:mechanosensitive ion channel domain-containing protein [Candidatus Uabimicrobium amorphum]|uniref:Mechanosensitive ion channel protein MscS n=1 Tax=Uabimicrobium amorphum TaxID=2596890 RepID=A0A5S9IQ87_UABAM|nr:mechanosensitive ion channel domain-containing protein [Candidatus Uabimicrobium amorphum]BBM85707.1 mechanosensitive ion channel protein MscS [Candidatus Uabimicrobium amorphum]